MITRTYKTKDECIQYWLDSRWTMVDPSVIEENPDFYERWSFVGKPCDDEPEYFDEDQCLAYTDLPMWSTWFKPDMGDADWIERHMNKVAGMGFTIILHDDKFWALGIDGAGYDFYERHWRPLYDARGLKWHDED